MATVLAFTPQHAALGGAILGVAVVGNLLLSGRVLGISGAVKGLVQGERQGWRTAFLLGGLLPVPLLAQWLPSAFAPLPATFPLARALLSGVLVGLGAALGNGCTSGHGICGNARLSPRSIAYTLTFMASGGLAAWASNTAGALSVAPVTPAFTALSTPELRLGLGALTGGAAALVALGAGFWAAHRGGKVGADAKQAAQLGASALVGAIFSTGLALSGMTRPEKVAGFLSVTHPAWDPSLMFVMAAAIGVSILPFQHLLGRLGKPLPALSKPVLADAYSLPSNASAVDRRLLVGSLLFGAGWGLSGMCPGPALVVAASPAASLGSLAYLGGLVGGLAAEPALTRQVPLLQPARGGTAAVVAGAAGRVRVNATANGGAAAAAQGHTGPRAALVG